MEPVAILATLVVDLNRSYLVHHRVLGSVEPSFAVALAAVGKPVADFASDYPSVPSAYRTCVG